jgi:uncharacterized iron-regulated membrane protein
VVESRSPTSAGGAPPRRSPRKPWVSVHRWLGVGVGAWFALVGLTGGILVFEDAVDAFLNPELLRAPRAGQSLPVHVLLERAEEVFPLGHVERIRPSAAPGDVCRMIVRVAPHMRVESPRVEAMLSPVDGRLLGTREAEEIGLSRPYLLKTLYEFHRNVLLGQAGSNIVGIAGFLLLASAVSGFVMAAPRTRAGWRRVIGVKVRAGATRVLFDVHRSLGTILAVLLILATVTGSTLVYLNYARDLVNLFSRVEPFPVVPWRTVPDRDWPTFETLVATVHRGYPALEIAEIHLPSKPTAGYVFYLRGPGDAHRLGDTIVWLHPATGELLLERSARTRTNGEGVMHWLFPLHTGTAFGTPGKIAMCIAGAAPFVLVFTGLWVWLRKRRAAAFEERRRERASTAAGPPV